MILFFLLIGDLLLSLSLQVPDMPTDQNMYILPSSCHPPHKTSNIPFSLAMRITRICTEPDTRDQRYEELKDLLNERTYPSGMAEAAIAKAKAIPTHIALKEVIRDKQSRRPFFVVSLDPRLPSINAI